MSHVKQLGIIQIISGRTGYFGSLQVFQESSDHHRKLERIRIIGGSSRSIADSSGGFGPFQTARESSDHVGRIEIIPGSSEEFEPSQFTGSMRKFAPLQIARESSDHERQL